MPDIVYYGSSLQYFDDNSKILTEAIQYKPRYVIVSDAPMGVQETFACAQVNMPGIVIPRWVFNQNEIIRLFDYGGYELIHESANYYPFHNFYSYREPYQSIMHKNLIFVRKISSDS